MSPGKINVVETCAHGNWGLITMSGEVNMGIIALLSPIDRLQGRVRGGQIGSTDLKISPRSGGVGASRQDKCTEELRSL